MFLSPEKQAIGILGLFITTVATILRVASMCTLLNLPLPPPPPPLKNVLLDLNCIQSVQKMVMYDYTDKEIMDDTKIKVLFIGGKNTPIDVHTHIENNILLLNT